MGGVAPPSVTTPVYCTKTDPQVCEGALDDFVDVLSGQVQGVEHAVAGHELRHSDESSSTTTTTNNNNNNYYYYYYYYYYTDTRRGTRGRWA